MEKRKIWLVIGTDTAWDIDDGWTPLCAFHNKEGAENFVKMWESRKPATDFEQFAAYIREVEYEYE